MFLRGNQQRLPLCKPATLSTIPYNLDPALLSVSGLFRKIESHTGTKHYLAQSGILLVWRFSVLSVILGWAEKLLCIQVSNRQVATLCTLVLDHDALPCSGKASLYGSWRSLPSSHPVITGYNTVGLEVCTSQANLTTQT
jgi:hypothetical protein